MVRQGAIDSPPKCPFILGFECAGDIEQVGEGVEDFQVSIHKQIPLPETLLLIIKCILMGRLIPTDRCACYVKPISN